MKPKISIIIPVYNAGTYLKECLESIINQTFGDIEIICVNDGSTDNSLDILNTYARKDKRIHIFTQENSGPAKARNVGLQNAHGTYLMFCDADDTYEPTMCEEMYQTISRENVDFVMCDVNVIEYVKNHGRDKANIDYHKLSYVGYNLLTYWLKTKINVLLWNKIFKFETIKRYKIKFPENYEADDNAFIWQYLSVSQTMFGLKKELYNYKLLSTSIMGNIFVQGKTNKLLDRIYATEYTIKFLIQNNLLLSNIWLLKVIENGIKFACPLLIKKDCINYLKLLNKKILCHFDINDIKKYSLLNLCLKKKYNKIIKKFSISSLNKIFRKVEFNGGKKYYFFKFEIFKKIKEKNRRKKYYLCGYKIFEKSNKLDVVLEACQRTNDKITEFFVRNILSTPIDTGKKYIICFDCLYDEGQECIDAFTFFQYLQEKGIPSKYICLKKAFLKNVIKNEENIIRVDSRYDFIINYSHLIRQTKAIITSFGLFDDLNDILKSLHYLDYIFIDHGVILMKKWVVDIYNSQHFDKILVPTKLTYNFYKENKIWTDEQMIIGGLPRWDLLKKETKSKSKNIFVFFTWRTTFQKEPVLANYYIEKIFKFLNNLIQILPKDVKINLAWHHELAHNNVKLPVYLDEKLNIIRTDQISRVIQDAQMLITDYSSVSWDFMYMDKPVLFYRFDKDELYLNDKDQKACLDCIQEDNKLYNCFYDEENLLRTVKDYCDNNFKLEENKKIKNEKIFWKINENCENLCVFLENTNDS